MTPFGWLDLGYFWDVCVAWLQANNKGGDQRDNLKQTIVSTSSPGIVLNYRATAGDRCAGTIRDGDHWGLRISPT